jgi:hypothetical protein
MTTALERPLRREVRIDGKAYTLTLSGEGFALTEKRRRRGFELQWRDVVNGDAQLAAALAAGMPARPVRYSAVRRMNGAHDGASAGQK